MNRPTGIECRDWEKDVHHASPLRCRYYQEGGTCELPSRMTCEEWERRQSKRLPLVAPSSDPPATTTAGDAAPGPGAPGGRVPAAVGLLTPPPDPKARPEPTVGPDGELRLSAQDPGPLKAGAARERARQIFAATFPGGGAAALTEVDPLPPAKAIPHDDLVALEATGLEFGFDVPREVSELPVFIVARRTGAKGRLEITMRDAATLRLIVDAFPGARLVKLTPPDPHHVMTSSPSADERCACARIMAEDRTRHFKGCPMRDVYPDHPAAHAPSSSSNTMGGDDAVDPFAS
jgi:hypothetical protein